MSYETVDGKIIKTIEIDVDELENIFNSFSGKFPFDLLAELDQLEFKIVRTAKIVELQNQETPGK